MSGEHQQHRADTQVPRAAGAAAAEAAILAQMDEGIIIADAKGKLVFVNEVATRMHGVAKLDVAPEDYAESYSLFTLEGAPYPSTELPLARAVLRGETVKDSRWIIRRPDGSEMIAIGSARPYGAPDGTQWGAVLTIRDDTERWHGERALSAAEERMRLATDAAEVGFWDLDPINDVLIWPPVLKAMFGLTPDAPVSLDLFFECLHPDDVERVKTAFEAALDPGRRALYDCEYRTIGREDGIVRWVAAKGRGLFEGKRCVRVLGTAIDVSQRRAEQEELRQLNANLEERVAEGVAEREKLGDALRQAQKMEAVGQLTGGIAHDFNNLLTIVTGNIDLLKRALAEDGDARLQRFADNALKGAERAAALTQRLLAFSRRQPLAPKAVNVDRLIADIHDLIARSLGETIAIERVASGRLWTVEIDPNQLESALVNLSVNARDAMPEGGKLTIETANIRLDEAYAARHAEVAAGQYVVIAVSDTGTGMKREVLDRVFEPFFTTKDVDKGTGLGLSMVYGFVKQSGGHIKLYSEPGEGTTVKIYLPRSHAEPDEPERALDAVPQAEAREALLVVEDDDDVRAYSVELLRELGYHVIEAHDGPSALRLLERQVQPIDLLFTDLVMPGMSGDALAAAARALQPRLKVLFTTGYARGAITHNGRLEPGVDMIAKPFTYDAIGRTLRGLLDRGRVRRVLLAEADATLRLVTADLLRELGFSVEVAGEAREVKGRVRAADWAFDALVLAGDVGGTALLAEVRAMRADLPVLLLIEERATAPVDDDACAAALPKPFDGAALKRALEALGLECAWAGREA